MGSSSFSIINDVYSVFYTCKIEILTGIFASLAIYSYFYRIRVSKGINIQSMKKKIQELKEELKVNPIMSEEKITYIEKILERIESYMKERFEKIEKEQEKQENRAEILEGRVVKIEKNNAITRREIALYVTIGVFVMLQILDKINII